MIINIINIDNSKCYIFNFYIVINRLINDTHILTI